MQRPFGQYISKEKQFQILEIGLYKTISTFFLVCIVCCVSFAREIIVDTLGSGEYTSIQEAVTASTDGDSIKILPGSYTESIVVDKNITLKGSGVSNTFITSRSGNAVLITSSDGATIKNCWIKAAQSGVATVNANTQANPDTPPGGITIIESCHIAECGDHGIDFQGSDSLSVTNTIIESCGGAGIHFRGSDRYSQSNSFSTIYVPVILSVENCVSTGNGQSGVWIDHEGTVDSWSITNCTFVYNGIAGVYGEEGDGTISNSIIAFNNDFGVYTGTGGFLSQGGNARISYSNLWNNLKGSVSIPSSLGLGNIEADPLLTDIYQLQKDSPCIDAGNPSPALRDSDGTRNDMGASGGSNASLFEDTGDDITTPPEEPTTPTQPIILPKVSNSFSEPTIASNGLTLVPPGSPGEFNLGDVFVRPLTSQTDESTHTDGFGISIVLDPEEGTTFLGSPIIVEDDYVFMRISAWTSSENVSIALGMLDAEKADTLADANLNGSIGANILLDASRFNNQFGYLELLYRAERGAVVPVFQAAHLSGTERVTVQFDNLMVYRIPKTVFPLLSNGESMMNSLGLNRFIRVGNIMVEKQ